MNNILIKGLAIDSRKVKPGDLFIALSGNQNDGHEFISDAIDNGATAILTEIPPNPPFSKGGVFPIIPFSDLKNSYGHIASRFYDEPSKSLPVIGITGTNGKTSTAHFIAQLMSLCGKKTAIIGTLGAGFLKSLKSLDCTTPDAIQTQQLLASFKEEGATAVAMEVSSHAIHQGRVEGVQFQSAIFTNLSQDHLDYHGNMEKYWAEKKRLFKEFNPSYSIVNLDNEFGRELANECSNVIAYSTQISEWEKNKQKIIFIKNLHLDANGITAEIHSPWGTGNLKCPILGRFNLSNLLAAIAAVCLQGIPLNEILNACKHLQTVPGRMVRMGGEKESPLVVIDYAHTPDALSEVLQALKPHCRGKLWCVFGCGGDRDKGKRPIMAHLAENLSDELVITQDNPRTEDPNQIIQEMLKGLKNPKNVFVETNRARAIQYAIHSAMNDDVILVAGKGHETYQIIGHEKKPFSDKKEIELALLRRADAF